MKNVLITGISSGIGAHLAQFLAKNGYRILGTCRSMSKIDNSILTNAHINLFELQLEDEQSMINAFNQIRETIKDKGLYALINNAGMVLPGAIEDINVDEMKALFQVNVFSAVKLIQLCIPELRRYGAGSRIINMSSVSGLFAAPFLGVYASSKFAIEALSDSLRREMTIQGIKVILIEPGPIRTQIWSKHLGIEKKYPDSSFLSFLKEGDQLIYSMEEGAMSLEKIEIPIMDALRSPKPKARYLIHKNKFLFFLIHKIMPVTLIDWIINRKLNSPKIKIRPLS